MNPLWDKATVKRLMQAVRKTSPDDWKASRARSGRGWLSLEAWNRRFWASMSPVVLGFFMCAGALAYKDAPMPLAAVCGLMALNFLSLGLISAHRIFDHAIPEIQSLVNTPARGRQVYLYILFVIQRKAWIRCLKLAVIGSVPMMFLDLIVADTLAWESTALAVFSGIIVVGSSLCVGVAAALLPAPLYRLVRVAGVSLMILMLWQLLRIFMPVLPSPAFIGEAVQFLPQAQIGLWVLGGAFPAAPVLGCTGALFLAVFLISHRLRDRGHAFPDDALEEDVEWGAEGYAAEAVKQWRRGIQDATDEDEFWDGETDGRPPETPDESLPLLLHPDAPKEHATPVSETFREAIASRCRIILQSTGPACPLEACLRPKLTESPRLRTARKMALFTGITVPFLAEAPAWMPDLWRHQFGIWFVFAAVFLFVINLGFTKMPVPHSLPLIASQWLRLPEDPAVYARHFFASQRRYLLRRCLLVLQMVGIIALVSLMWIGLRSFLGLSTQGPLTLSRFVHGEVSFINLTLMLLAAAILIRHLETMAFFRDFFDSIKWRGLSNRLSFFYGVVMIFSAGLLLVAIGIAVFLSGSEVSQTHHWFPIPACILGSEILHQLNVRMALLAARWGRGDWKGLNG